MILIKVADQIGQIFACSAIVSQIAAELLSM